MTQYYVSWHIDVEADSFEEAAINALEIQRDPNSLATIFTVKNETTGDSRTIDNHPVE